MVWASDKARYTKPPRILEIRLNLRSKFKATSNKRNRNKTTQIIKKKRMTSTWRDSSTEKCTTKSKTLRRKVKGNLKRNPMRRWAQLMMTSDKRIWRTRKAKPKEKVRPMSILTVRIKVRSSLLTTRGKRTNRREKVNSSLNSRRTNKDQK
jgi:hypothetical protein